MGFARYSTPGWRAPARAPTGYRAQGTYRLAGAIFAAILTAALPWSAAQDWASVSALANRFEAIHMVFGASLLAGGLYIALSAVSALATVFVMLAELTPRLALGGALMGVLPFAQGVEPPAANPPSDTASSVASAEMQVGLYTGKSLLSPSEVMMKGPGGTDIVLKDVKWRGDSFKPSPFYGGRGIDWNSKMPALGVMVDYTHAKATAIRSHIVSQSGKRNGEDVPPQEPVSATFRKLEMTHGLNFLTVNAVYRAAGLHRRVVPYVGLGIGISVPYLHMKAQGRPRSEDVLEAQMSGAAYQLFGGLEWRVFKSDRRSLFTEYKLTYTANDMRLYDDGRLKANVLIHQFNLGGYFTPWRQGAAAK